jgi:SAM-dependent methyltransferase
MVWERRDGKENKVDPIVWINWKHDFGKELADRIEDMDLDLSSKSLAELWSDYSNYDVRRLNEVPFIISQSAEFFVPHQTSYGKINTPFVLNATTGTGEVDRGLKAAGIELLVTNEMDPYFAEAARKELKKDGIKLVPLRKLRPGKNIGFTDFWWQGFINGFGDSNFDVVTCLGNSLTYVFGEEQQLECLKGFYEVLRSGGKLIIDERNYPMLLKGSYNFTMPVYKGYSKVVPSFPFVSDKVVVIQIEKKQDYKKAHILMYPFKEGEMRGLLENAGFRDIKVFGDYKATYDPKQAEFITYTARK